MLFHQYKDFPSDVNLVGREGGREGREAGCFFAYMCCVSSSHFLPPSLPPSVPPLRSSPPPTPFSPSSTSHRTSHPSSLPPSLPQVFTAANALLTLLDLTTGQVHTNLSMAGFWALPPSLPPSFLLLSVALPNPEGVVARSWRVAQRERNSHAHGAVQSFSAREGGAFEVRGRGLDAHARAGRGEAGVR